MYKHQHTIPLTQLKWQMTQLTKRWILIQQEIKPLTILTMMGGGEQNLDLMLNVMDKQDKLKQDVLALGNVLLKMFKTEWDKWIFNISQD